MNQDNERDELAEALHGRFPTGARSFMVLDANMAHAIATAIQSAGYRKPRTITNMAELDALPVGSMVKFNGAAFPLAAVKNWESKHPRKDGTPLSEWLTTGYEDAFDTGDLDFPAVVLWEPEA